MGSTRWEPDKWASHSAAVAAKPREEIFTSRHLNDDLDPSKFSVRESCDSEANPNSTPIILMSDVTGSMGHLAEQIVKTGLGTIMQEIYDRKPIPDPHILCGAIGDAMCDQAPLQATQFEASIVLAEQLTRIWIEGMGGGNGGESYHLAWLFAAYKTRCDAMLKRRRKGYLFTIGDECVLDSISKEHCKRFLNIDVERDVSTPDALTLAMLHWEVFHLIVKPRVGQPVLSQWGELLGDRAIAMESTEGLAEVIVSLIQINEGADRETVAASWNGDTSIIVANATSKLTKRSKKGELVNL